MYALLYMLLLYNGIPSILQGSKSHNQMTACSKDIRLAHGLIVPKMASVNQLRMCLSTAMQVLMGTQYLDTTFNYFQFLPAASGKYN